MDREISNPYWARNLAVCVAGSFTTIVGMTLMLPFLPFYIAQLGVKGHAAVVQWAGLAYGAAFFAAALVAPLWGRLGDRFGRKSMLVRASLGMAISTALIGFARTPWQLLALRLLTGLAGGYASGSTILVATQTPRARAGWALGVLSSGVMAGNLIGPLIGGALPPLIGIRSTFQLSGAAIFLAFIATTLLINEGARRKPGRATGSKADWSSIPDKRAVIAMLVTGALLMLANMSIEPIITVFVANLVPDTAQVTLVSGVVMSAGALGSILSASRLGRLADCIGHRKIIIFALLVSGVLLVPQAFVSESWQLIALRFLMGVSLGGILPCIAAVIRHSVPDGMAGSVLGYSVSAQFAGQVIGPIVGGVAGGHFGMPAVFLGTAGIMILGAVLNIAAAPKSASSAIGPR